MNALKFLAVVATSCVLALSAGAADKDNAKKLVGKWEVSKADEGTLPKGAVIEFTKDGKLKLTAKKGDNDFNVEGTYKMDGDDKFTVSMKVGDDEHKTEVTILSIDDKSMKTKNKEGKTVEFTKK
jgi:uncharacterized protein (TIGR03066 family)